MLFLSKNLAPSIVSTMSAAKRVKLCEYFADPDRQESFTSTLQIEIFVEHEAKKIKVGISYLDTVRQLKEKIEKELCIPIERQKIRFQDKELVDQDRTLMFYRIDKGDTIYMTS